MRRISVALSVVTVMFLFTGCFTGITVAKLEKSKDSKLTIFKEKNVPILTKNNVLTFKVVGQGVAPVNTVSPAQARALAKRAAIADAYRQLGEKIAGVKVEGRDKIVNMITKKSIIRTYVNALIKNATITDSATKDGLYEVEMELKMYGKKWYPIFASN